MYRVGPLARLNICDFAGTPRADANCASSAGLRPRQAGDQQFPLPLCPVHRNSLLPGEDRGELDDPTIIGNHMRSKAGVNNLVGVGVSEAPRGTLFHEYHVDEDGVLQKVNMIIATGQNNMAMNKTVKQIAQLIYGGR